MFFLAKTAFQNLPLKSTFCEIFNFFQKKDPLDTPQEEIPVRFLSLHFSKRPYCHFLRLKNYQILSLKKYQCCKFEIFKNEKITIYHRKPKKSFLVLKGLTTDL